MNYNNETMPHDMTVINWFCAVPVCQLQPGASVSGRPGSADLLDCWPQAEADGGWSAFCNHSQQLILKSTRKLKGSSNSGLYFLNYL